MIKIPIWGTFSVEGSRKDRIMSTLISVDTVIRKNTGFDTCLGISECNQLQEPELLVIEPFFTNFKAANNDQLGAIFKVAAECAVAGKPMPRTIVVNISYSKINAVTIKGYLLDVVEHFKGMGYKNFTSVHIPFESYGCPMVGSVLSLIFCKDRIAYLPVARTVLPGAAFEGLLYHAMAGRMRGSVYAGAADVSGFLNSNRSFLPDLSVWAEEGLRAEYRKDNSSVSTVFKDEHVHELFGVSSYMHPLDLHLCTPPVILATFLNNLKQLNDLTDTMKKDAAETNSQK